MGTEFIWLTPTQSFPVTLFIICVKYPKILWADNTVCGMWHGSCILNSTSAWCHFWWSSQIPEQPTDRWASDATIGQHVYETFMFTRFGFHIDIPGNSFLTRVNFHNTGHIPTFLGVPLDLETKSYSPLLNCLPLHSPIELHIHVGTYFLINLFRKSWMRVCSNSNRFFRVLVSSSWWTAVVVRRIMKWFAAAG